MTTIDASPAAGPAPAPGVVAAAADTATGRAGTDPAHGRTHARPVGSRVDAFLEAAREGLDRLTPHQAAEAAAYGALLVDTRPVQDRRRFGEIPGSLIVERNLLEWRLDPTSPDRLAEAGDPARTVVVFCNEGYASSFAAASLRELGLENATDMIGGFHAWAAAGLPTTPFRDA